MIARAEPGPLPVEASPRTVTARRPSGSWTEVLKDPGLITALPMLLLMLVGFVGPLTLVILFSFMPEKTFSLLQLPTLANFTTIVTESYYISFITSIVLAVVTVLICVVICYPVAYAMVLVFGRWASLLTMLITAPLFVADNLRLMGWVLFLVKGGVVSGTAQTLFGLQIDSLLYTTSATIFGLVYVYLPFMLLPIIIGVGLVPEQMREAAYDLGASRWQVLREVDIPLAMPGIMIGMLMCFILAAGALSEARILGGSAVVMIAQDIQQEFTFAQNWPKGSALSVLLIVVAGALAFAALRKIDLDGVFGRR